MFNGGKEGAVTEVDGENGPALTALVTNYFLLSKAADGILSRREPGMRQAITQIKQWAHSAKATMRSRRVAGTLQPPSEGDEERALLKMPSRGAMPQLVSSAAPGESLEGKSLPRWGLSAQQGIMRIAPRVDGRISQATAQSAREVHEERDKFFSQGHHGCRAGDVQAVLAAMGSNATSDLQSKLNGSGLRKGVHWDMHSGESRTSLALKVGGGASSAGGGGRTQPDHLSSFFACVRDVCFAMSGLLRPPTATVAPHVHFLDDDDDGGDDDEEELPGTPAREHCAHINGF